MGTPLSKVYNKFLGQIDDKEFLLIDEDILEDLMLDYLDSSISDFFQCKVDLSFTPPKRCEVSQQIQGQSSQIEFTPEEGEITSIKVENMITNEVYEENVHYSFVRDLTLDNKVKIVFLGEEDSYFKVTYTLEGYFENELRPIEIKILALGMLLAYLKPKIMTQDSLKQFVSDKDFSKLSGANMLLRLINLKKNIEKELDVLQSKYSFEDFKGWN